MYYFHKKNVLGTQHMGVQDFSLSLYLDEWYKEAKKLVPNKALIGVNIIRCYKDINGYINQEIWPTLNYRSLANGVFLILPHCCILEVKLPCEPFCPSVGRLVGLSVCHNFFKGLEVSLACSYRSSCFSKCSPSCN